LGLWTGNINEIWAAQFDAIQVWDIFYLYFYQVAGGGAYLSIDEVYIDGALWLYDPPVKKLSRRKYNSHHPLLKRYKKQGRRPSDDVITKIPAYGAISFSIDVGSEVLLKVTKNTTTHPVDIIQAIMGEIGESHRVDSVSFAQAKAARPLDVVGVWIEDTSAKDAISEICSTCLYEFWESQGMVKLRAYTGLPQVPAMALTAQDFFTAERTDETEEIRNVIKATYGWHDRNPRAAILPFPQDDDSIAIFGEKPEDLQLEWGEMVGCDSRLMMASLANLLLIRLKGVRRLLELTGFYNLARLEPGDFIEINSALVNAVPTVYEIYRNEIDLGMKQCVLSLVKFMGEGW